MEVKQNKTKKQPTLPGSTPYEWKVVAFISLQGINSHQWKLCQKKREGLRMLFGESFCFSSASMTYVLRRAKLSCSVGPFELLFRHFFAHNFEKKNGLTNRHFIFVLKLDQKKAQETVCFAPTGAEWKQNFEGHYTRNFLVHRLVGSLFKIQPKQPQSIEQNNTFNEKIEKNTHANLTKYFFFFFG